MRFTSAVKKSLKKSISVEDVYMNPTIQEQARLLGGKPRLSDQDMASTRHEGPPGTDDMAHTRGLSQRAERTRELAEPLLEQLELRWDDVEDVIPVTDTGHFYLRYQRPQTWNQRHVYNAQNADHGKLLEAWKACLTQHPTLRTIVLDYYKVILLHFIMRCNNRWFNASPATWIRSQDEIGLTKRFHR
jgi:hypothetical protein